MKRYSEHIISNAKLMAEWDWKENEKEGINPYKLTLGSNKKASWICPKGHKYTKEIYRL